MNKPKTNKTFTKPCRICKSPLRGEIEFLVKQGISNAQLGKKYHQAFGIAPISFTNMCIRHTKKKHPPLIDMTPAVLPTQEEIERQKSEPVNFHTYANKLLQTGYQNIDPTTVKHQHVIQAQRAVIEEQKVKGTLDNQRLLLMRFLRGNVKEGEVIDATTTRIEALPENTD